MRLYNGSFYVIVTRQFIDWVMTNQVAQDFLNWTHDTWGPEEIIWATLSRYSGAPGSEPDDGRSIANRLLERVIVRTGHWQGLSNGNGGRN